MNEDEPLEASEFIRIGDYYFKEPYVPTFELVEEAEEVIFSDPSSSTLNEEERRRNVVKLAIFGVASERLVTAEEGATYVHDILLLGGNTMQVRAIRQADGTITREYQVVNGGN